MEMNFKGLQDKAAFGEIGVKLPRFDWERMCEKSRKAPVWVHFGAGNIFRGYIAGLQQKLLDDGVSACGIVAVDTSAELIRDVYHAYDNMTMLVGLKPDGSTDNEVIASVSEAIKADSADALAWERLSEIFMCAGLQMVSFTITEKGYALFDAQGQIFPLVAEDIANGPSMPRHGMAMVAALMYKRFTKGEAPISLVSMDNCSHNGDKLKESILTIARGWQEKGY
ncbi:MAG: mannitol dehydrogenase family protein, partial [Lachnospiraceae bacterium]|nr:mannitol dehydrogenase family protein [Lachnospiraceae bacterium]